MEYPDKQDMTPILLCQNSTCVVVADKKWDRPGLEPSPAGGLGRLLCSRDLASFMQETCNTGPSDDYDMESTG